MSTTIKARLSKRGGALITRQALRDSRSLNPFKRIKAMRYLNQLSRKVK